MSAWSQVLSPAERAEVEQFIVAAFVDEAGATRGTSEAKAKFVESVHVAQEAGRLWADAMLDDWADQAAGNFAVQMWKRRDAFTATALGVQRVRSLNRGRRSRDENGRARYVQESLLTWTLDYLKDELVAEASRAKEARINLETYAALIRLIKETEQDTVGDALNAVGKSLDEYLAQEAVA